MTLGEFWFCIDLLNLKFWNFSFERLKIKSRKPPKYGFQSFSVFGLEDPKFEEEKKSPKTISLENVVCSRVCVFRGPFWGPFLDYQMQCLSGCHSLLAGCLGEVGVISIFLFYKFLLFLIVNVWGWFSGCESYCFGCFCALLLCLATLHLFLLFWFGSCFGGCNRRNRRNT